MAKTIFVWVILILTMTSSHCKGTGKGIQKFAFAILTSGELITEDDYEVEHGWSWVVAEGCTIWAITEDWSMASVGGSVSR